MDTIILQGLSVLGTIIGVVIANWYANKNKRNELQSNETIASNKALWQRIESIEKASATRVRDVEAALQQVNTQNDVLISENATLSATVQIQSAQIARLQEQSYEHKKLLEENAVLREKLDKAYQDIADLRREIELLKRGDYV